jgi:hypothetical protein
MRENEMAQSHSGMDRRNPVDMDVSGCIHAKLDSSIRRWNDVNAAFT